MERSSVRRKRIVVAMSGGVDSSTSAHLLKERGFEVVGLFMRSGVQGSVAGRNRGCCSVEDAQDAQRVADQLRIPFYVLNFEKEFEEIIRYFCEEYNRGRTPNPCIVCNQKLKFGKLLKFAETLGADAIATGHYARVEHNHRHILRRGVDLKKDQSYVLFSLAQKQLARALFPVGGLSKPEVRRIASDAQLRVREKPESQEICFVPDDDYVRIIRERSPEKFARGEIVDGSGKILGYHNGIQHFTIGQRRGLGVACGVPLYVIEIDARKNRIVVGKASEVRTRKFSVTKLNWIALEELEEPLECFVKIRYASREAKASVYPESEDRVIVEFFKPQAAVTPGQAAVFYNGDTVVGGGWIERRLY